MKHIKLNDDRSFENDLNKRDKLLNSMSSSHCPERHDGLMDLKINGLSHSMQQKLDDLFLVGKFCIVGYSTPYRLDRTSQRVEFFCIFEKIFPLKC